MLSYALTFLVLAIIAGVLGASGVAAMGNQHRLCVVRYRAGSVPREHDQRTPHNRVNDSLCGGRQREANGLLGHCRRLRQKLSPRTRTVN